MTWTNALTRGLSTCAWLAACLACGDPSDAWTPEEQPISVAINAGAQLTGGGESGELDACGRCSLEYCSVQFAGMNPNPRSGAVIDCGRDRYRGQSAPRAGATSCAVNAASSAPQYLRCQQDYCTDVCLNP